MNHTAIYYKTLRVSYNIYSMAGYKYRICLRQAGLPACHRYYGRQAITRSDSNNMIA
ncbi:MAG: hypothetical protein JXA06_04850 [Bacteroidetes bacterium]|nr:hypothetical protein [Bacteroidota bacterium]